MTETKVDKRTKAYKDSQKAGEMPIGTAIPGSGTVVLSTDIPIEVTSVDIPPGITVSVDETLDILREILRVLRQIRDADMTTPMTVEPPVKESGMTPVEFFEKCMKCGNDLPGLSEPRRQPEPCDVCVMKNY